MWLRPKLRDNSKAIQFKSYSIQNSKCGYALCFAKKIILIFDFNNFEFSFPLGNYGSPR